MKLSPAMRMFLWAMALASGLVAAKQLIGSFEVSGQVDELHRKDFVQEFCFAKAILAGENPYQPMPEMVRRWLEPSLDRGAFWDHPAPHPPPMAILSVPFGFVEYRFAVLFWLVLELGLLAFAWNTLIRWWNPDTPWSDRVLLFLLSLSLGPIVQELYFGNLSLILVSLIIPAWLSLRKGDDVRGGAWLGIAIAIKLAGWPIALWLLMTRRWRAFSVAVGLAAALNGLAVVVMSFERVIEYYGTIGPAIARMYQHHESNYSLWTIAPRLLVPFHSVANVFVAEIPGHAPELGRRLSRTAPIFFLTIGLWLAYWRRSFDSSFGILVCVSIVVNPVAWDHTLLLTCIPIAVTLKRLAVAGWPRGLTITAAACFAATMAPQKAYLTAAAMIFATPDADGIRMMPFVPGIITYVPLLALIGWIVLLTTTDEWPDRAIERPSDSQA